MNYTQNTNNYTDLIGNPTIHKNDTYIANNVRASSKFSSTMKFSDFN